MCVHLLVEIKIAIAQFTRHTSLPIPQLLHQFLHENDENQLHSQQLPGNLRKKEGKKESVCHLGFIKGAMASWCETGLKLAVKELRS